MSAKAAVKRKAGSEVPGGDQGEAKKPKISKPSAKNGAAPVRRQDKAAGAAKGARPKAPAPKPVPQNSAERKQMLRAKKGQKNPNFPLVQECVFIWEQLRPREASVQDKQKLVSKIVAKAAGKFKELSMNHSSSRVMQACLKYGTEQHRKTIWKDLKEHLVELSRSNYGSFVARKVIDVAKKAEVAEILRAFKGNVALLFRHPCGSAVMSDLYDALPGKDRNAMIAEFYSKEHMLFGSSHADCQKTGLREIWDSMDAPKRRAVMQHLIQRLQPIVEKGLLDPVPVHRLVHEYLLLAPSGMLEDAVELLSGESLLRMVHTHEGAKVGCMVAAYGTAKDRKKLVKALKTHVLKMAADEFAYAVLIKILSCVDDTQLMRKVIVQELVEGLPQLSSCKHGSRVLLYLLHPECTRYLPPHVMQMLQPQKRLVAAVAKEADVPAGGEGEEGSKSAGAHQGDAADDGAGGEQRVVGISKKDPEARRVELLGSGTGSLASALLAHCVDNAREMVTSQFASDIVVELCHGDCRRHLWDKSQADVRKLHAAVAAAAADTACGSKDESAAAVGPSPASDEPVLEHYHSSRAILKIIGSGRGDLPCEPAAAAFCESLWQAAVKGRCKSLITSHAAKVVAALSNCCSASVVSGVRAELKGCVSDVDAWCSGAWKVKGKK